MSLQAQRRQSSPEAGLTSDSPDDPRFRAPSAHLLAGIGAIVAVAVLSALVLGSAERLSRSAFVGLLVIPPLASIVAWRRFGSGWLASPGGLINIYIFLSIGVYSAAFLTPENLRTLEFLNSNFSESSGLYGPMFSAAFSASTFFAFKDRRRVGPRPSVRSIHKMRFAARAGLFVSSSYFLFLALTSELSQRGENQVERDLGDSVRVGMIIATIALTVALLQLSRQLGKVPLRDYAFILAGPIFLSATGNRFVLFSILAVIGVFYALRSRLTLIFMALGTATILSLNHAIRVYRSGIDASGFGVWDAWFEATGTAARNLALVASYVPKWADYQYGETYLVSLTRLLPAGTSQWVFGDFSRYSGAQVFRQILGYTNPNHGIGFSLPGEAYLNFGVVGLVGVGAILGLLCVYLWSVKTVNYFRPTGSLYFVLIASLPMALRSDSVGIFKSLTYSLILLAAIWLFGVWGSRPQTTRS